MVTMGCHMKDGLPQKMTSVQWLKDGAPLSSKISFKYVLVLVLSSNARLFYVTRFPTSGTQNSEKDSCKLTGYIGFFVFLKLHFRLRVCHWSRHNSNLHNGYLFV